MYVFKYKFFRLPVRKCFNKENSKLNIKSLYLVYISLFKTFRKPLHSTTI